MTNEERDAIVNRIVNDYGKLVKDSLDELLRKFVKDVEKKGQWKTTGCGEFAFMVKVTDIYDIAEQYGVAIEEEDEDVSG